MINAKAMLYSLYNVAEEACLIFGSALPHDKADSSSNFIVLAAGPPVWLLIKQHLYDCHPITEVSF
jgi:hypothetical protein